MNDRVSTMGEHEERGGRRKVVRVLGDVLSRPAAKWLIVGSAAVIAAIAALPLATTEGGVGPGRVSLRLSWDGAGATEIAVPPIGSVTFDTHDVPVAVQARIERIDPASVQQLVEGEHAIERFERQATTGLRSLATKLAWRSLLVALVVGALVGMLLSPRRWQEPLVGAASAILAVAILLASVWVGFSRDAFGNPRFEGALDRAPAVLAAVETQFGGLRGAEGRLRILAGHVTELFAVAAGTDPSLRQDEVRILHVSDIHSNPVGLELVRNLAANFDVDAILDTGDLTSFGLPVEAAIGNLISGMPAPYYLVAGNHDTMANRRALAAYSNLTVVDDTVFDVGGVRILGIPDPAVTANGEDTDSEANAKRDAQAATVAALTRGLRPDVLAVSTLRQAAFATGSVPLVVAGNTHRRSERVERGTRLLTVGSTGATGLGALTVDTNLPYEAELLHFRGRRLVTLDYVVFHGTGGSYTISRTELTAGTRTATTTTSSTTSTTRPAP